ncbi:uncharacterized protein LOC124911665 [Impatiens glandulifera]|uniref:uncharacterized protein LOC124911665 n=1 Tax=Impatiens glandulifera TaxID=253017 RepID=UPI001FB192B5|nr:uncharacterized protein LOC124911665 [Impatiens glandulifera]
MAATGASGDGFIRGFFDGCISDPDSGINRRPYHKNCTCALHKSRTQCSHTSTTGCNNVSYPIRRTWSEGSFTRLIASAATYVSPGSSPALATATATATNSPVSKAAAKAYLFPYNEE